MPVRKGLGMFARIFMEHFPLLPDEDEGRLRVPTLRENFIEKLFALKRWREVLAKKESRGKIYGYALHFSSAFKNCLSI
jgi:hypothetical protein